MEQPSSSNTSPRSSLKLERNIKERDRRLQMKQLLSQLSSTIHPQSTLKLSVPELVDEATNYVKKLHERTEKLKHQKATLESLISDGQQKENNIIIQGRSRSSMVDVRRRDSDLEVNLLCGSDKKFMLHDVVRALQDEAVEVTSLTYHHIEDNNIIIYTIKAQAIISRIGIETSRIQQRLEELID